MIIGITCGHFNPLHKGHLSLLKDSKSKCDFLIVIVNNDKQQILKKGKIIMDEQERFSIVDSLKMVDYTFLSIDSDSSVSKSLEYIFKNTSFPTEFKFVLFKGGDRSNLDTLPSLEVDVCKKYNCEIKFGIGGFEKQNSSSAIIDALN